MRVLTGFAGFISLVYAGIVAGAAPSPLSKPDLERGKQIATTVCMACHGADGNSALAANPILAGQHGDYVALQLAAFKSGARPSAIMQGMASPLSAEDMRNLGAYYEMQKTAPNVARDKALAARGQQIWRGGIAAIRVPACAGCHGAAGKGIPVQFPRLAGQHADLSFGWLKAFASGARAHPVMSPVAVKMSEADMKAVAEYAAGLR